MTLMNKIDKLSDVQRSSLHNTLVNASRAIRDGDCCKEVLRRARHRHIGAMKSIYEMLHDTPKEEIDKIINELHINHNRIEKNI